MGDKRYKIAVEMHFSAKVGVLTKSPAAFDFADRFPGQHVEDKRVAGGLFRQKSKPRYGFFLRLMQMKRCRRRCMFSPRRFQSQATVNQDTAAEFFAFLNQQVQNKKTAQQMASGVAFPSP